MNKTEWAAYKSALRVLDNGPKTIKAAKEEYENADAYMKEHRKDWSENGQRTFYAAAAEKRDKAIQDQCRKMEQAIATVRQFNSFPGEEIDLDSVRLQNALTIVNTMKEKLPHAQQLTILDGFRGQPATLRFLGDVFDKNGLYYGQLARDMAKPVSDEALDNMEQAVFYAQYSGTFDENRIYWTQRAFSDAAERLGLDIGATDPFEAALRTMHSTEDNPENQRIISSGIYELNHGNKDMTDGEKAAIINRVTAQIEKANAARQDHEITRQAQTAQALKGLEGTSQALENVIAGMEGGNN